MGVWKSMAIKMKSVIFDLDGVLVSTDELHYEAWKRLAEELAITGFTRADNERQRGVSRMESLEVVLERSTRVFSDEEKTELAERKNRYYVEMLERLDDSAVLTGVVDVLAMLRQMGVRIAVGSASKNTPMILDKTGLAEYIDQVSCGLDTSRSKPDPEVFLIAARKLQVDPVNCVVVEDSAAGIVAAKAAGMKSLGVGPFYTSLGADYEAPDLSAGINWERILNE
jgi:beta-phosphoglucomutase